jgi:putative oxidoreductase
MLAKFTKRNGDYFYFVFRVLVGFLFFQHGAQKLFGMFSGNQVSSLWSLFGLAGVIEFFGGLLIIFGLLTRYAALFGIFDMIGAWFIAHAPAGWIPIQNGGELALLFLASFLVIIVIGSRKWGLDNRFFKEKK